MAGNTTNIVLRMALAGRDSVRRALRDTSGDLDKMGRAGLGAAKGIAGLGDRALLTGVKGLGVAAAGVGIAAVGAAAGVVALVKTSLGSLARIERINAQTASAIKATGGAAQVTTDHIIELTGALEGTTATEAESIQQGANLLLTFTNIRNGVGDGNDIFDQATRAITDMSRAMDTTGGAVIDTTGTAIQLGKALNDPIKGVTALAKVGVSFTQQQRDQIKAMVESGKIMDAQKVILNELAKEFGGAGEAFAATSKGQIELAGHAWGTFGEALSAALLPAVGNVSGAMADLFNYAATDLAPNLEGVFTKAGDAITAASYRAADAVTYLIASTTLKGSLADFFTGKDASGLADEIGEALGLSMKVQTTQVEPVLNTIMTKGAQVASVLGSAFAALQSIPISPLNLLNDALTWASENTETFKKILVGAAIAYGTARMVLLGYAIVQGIVAVRTAAATAATWLNTAATRVSTSTAGTWIGVKGLEFAAWVRSTAAAAGNTVAMAANRVAYGASYLATWIGVKGLEFAAWARTTAATAASTAAMAAQRVAYGVGWLTTFIGVKAIEAGAWARSTALAIANRVAIIAGAAASGIARGAILAWTAAQWLLNVALSANPIGLVVAAVALLVGGIVIAYQRSETFRNIVNGVWQGIKTLASWLGQAFLKFTPLGQVIMLVKNNFDSIRNAAGAFVDKIKDALTWVGKLADKLSGGLLGKALGAVGVDIDGARAAGGPVTAGRTYLTGERGRELFTPDTNGRIIPAQRTAELLSTATSTPVVGLPSEADMFDDLPSLSFGDVVLTIDRREIGRAALGGLETDAARR